MKRLIEKIFLLALLILPLLTTIHGEEFESNQIEVVVRDDDLMVNKQEASFSFTPGDKWQQVITWKNASSTKHQLYFKCISDNEKLLEVMSLTITCHNDLLYQGKANQVMKTWKLGEFIPDQNEYFVITLSLPSEVNNEYSMEKANIKMIIANEVILDDQKLNIFAPQTGVHFPYKIGLLFMGSLLGMLILIKRRDKNATRIKK